jgi:hypothetical protein
MTVPVRPVDIVEPDRWGYPRLPTADQTDEDRRGDYPDRTFDFLRLYVPAEVVAALAGYARVDISIRCREMWR